MKMEVKRDWVFERDGRATGDTAVSTNPKLTAGDIIEVADDWAMKLAKRGVAVVYKGKDAATPFPPPASFGVRPSNKAMADVMAAIEKRKEGENAAAPDVNNAGGKSGADNPGKGGGGPAKS